MRVALFGGTGFVGSYIVDELVKNEHQPVLLMRPGSESKVRHRDQCTLVSGDIRDSDAIRKTLEGCDAAIYLIGILRESPGKGITFEEMQYRGARRTIDLAVEAGVRRFLLMSANGVKPDGTPYQRTKYQAEQYLESTELNWTVFRPSIIFGDPRGQPMEFCSMLYQQMIKPPLPAPLFYKGLVPTDAGTFRMAPVHVRDVAAVFVKSLDQPEVHAKIFAVCGPDALQWKEIIRLIGKVVGKDKLMVPAPAFGVKSVATILDRFEFFPVTRDQITMLLEGNTCDSTEVFERLDVVPTTFDENSLAYLKSG